MARARQSKPSGCIYVGKGGLKLEFALKTFAVDIEGWTAADLGCHVGGFTDCLIRHGAAKVYAVDTSYGALDWRLRSLPQVEIHERANALHWRSPEPVDLVTIDLGWTRQALALPAAREIARLGGIILSLIKPQYEASPTMRHRGVVAAADLPQILAETRAAIPLTLCLEAEAESPLRGSGGNMEFWFKLRRIE